MRHHTLAIAISLPVFPAYAIENKQLTVLPVIRVNAENDPFINQSIVVENRNADNKTLGDALKHLSGVQSSAFGPNSGAPVIRSLSGNRVQILENGQSIYEMNSISGNINIPFDPLFTQSVTVNKSSDSVRYGGNAIGGSVNIDSGLIDTAMPNKSSHLELVAKKGWNDFDAKGFKLNLNNQSNFSTNLLFSSQDMSAYKIPGEGKASVCNSGVFPATGGVNTALADACQKEARIQKNYNTASQPYIDQFMTENPDWADGSFSFYTDKPTSVWSGKTYTNPVNPKYVPNTQQYTENKINKDVTPNYKNKLGNSYLDNQHFAIGSTYFLNNGRIGLSADSKKSEYGVPGFSLENKSFQSTSDSIPVGVKTDQRRYALDSEFNFSPLLLKQIQFDVSKSINTSGEYLGSKMANNYKFDTQQAELLLKHRPAEFWNGFIGFNQIDRKVVGHGNLRYLPNINTQTQAVFIKEKLDFDWLELDAGYRNEKVEHKIQKSDFVPSRNSPNTKLTDTKFNLESYSFGSYLKYNDLLGLKLRYSVSDRAPEINELYASHPHYSIMLQEEGNQKLKEERSKNLELTGLFNYKNFNFEATVYKMKYDKYLYLTHSGAQMRNRLPLKYWTQTDAEITGFEIDLKQKFELNQYGNLLISAFADLVKNKNLNPNKTSLANDGNYLPNMPTNRYGLNLEWNKNDWSARLSNIYYDQAQYLGKNVSKEIPLPSYNLLDLQIQKHFKLQNANFDVFLNGSNLLNEDARPQNSPLKYIAPLPGRGVQLGISMKI